MATVENYLQISEQMNEANVKKNENEAKQLPILFGNVHSTTTTIPLKNK